MNDYMRYFISAIIFIIVLNIIIQMAKSQSQAVKIVGMASLLICVFFLYKIFTRNDEPKASEAPKTDGLI